MFHSDARFKTVIEPFRLKMVEPIHFTSRDQRVAALEAANYNLFGIRSEDVLVDLLTDSGTGAMSMDQWAALLRGDESYAGSTSFRFFERVVQELTGFAFVLPTHQGRAAERLLFTVFGGPGKIIPNNSHFDTTRAHVELTGAVAQDLPSPLAADTQIEAAFKGDMDLVALEALLSRDHDRVPLVCVTITNNAAGGQPVSMANLRAVRALCDQYGKPMFLDAARFAENAWFVKEREPGFAAQEVRAIAEEAFRIADGTWVSAKKDGLVNIGGFLAFKDEKLLYPLRNLLILNEGFPTYGGLAGRDLEAMAVGLQEVTDEDYLRYRARSVAWLGKGLEAGGIPVLRPFGGHAVYLDAKRLLPDWAPDDLPAQALACALYVEGGVRGVEIGTLMFGRTDPATGRQIAAPRELVRLALPRRVYTQAHVDYVIEVGRWVAEHPETLRKLRVGWEGPALRHFTARLLLHSGE
ncbi:tryptophanase [Deltaproteobacteria bacterium]|nr:tryptophanase [Deltaproteobacteria bacterium]